MIHLDPLSVVSSIVDAKVPPPYYDEHKNIFRKSTTLLLSVQFQSLCHFSLKSWDLSASSDSLSSIPCSSTYFCRYQLKWLWTVSLARFIFIFFNTKLWEVFFFHAEQSSSAWKEEPGRHTTDNALLSSISFYFKVSSYCVLSVHSQTEVFPPQCLCLGLDISSVWDFLPLIRLEHLKLFFFQTELYSDKLGLIGNTWHYLKLEVVPVSLPHSL